MKKTIIAALMVGLATAAALPSAATAQHHGRSIIAGRAIATGIGTPQATITPANTRNVVSAATIASIVDTTAAIIASAMTARLALLSAAWPADCLEMPSPAGR